MWSELAIAQTACRSDHPLGLLQTVLAVAKIPGRRLAPSPSTPARRTV